MKNALSNIELIKFIENQPIRISVFGEFSSGKTTFVNGLIGEAILSVAVDPTTAVPTYVRFAKEFNILVHLNNGKKLQLFTEDPPFWARFVGRQSVLNTLKKQEGEIRNFLKEWTKEGERSEEVKNIIIELPLPWLKHNIELVDTPGTESGIDSHKKHTQQVSKDTDIAIFLIDARQGRIKRTEFNFINKVQKSVSQSFVVINKIDLLDKDDDERLDIIDFITKESLPKHWKGVIQPNVFAISSLVRLDQKLATQEPHLLDDFNQLILFVEKIATTQRGKILLNRLGNPEKDLFKAATQYESENKFDKAHRIYFDLLDVLQTAKMDVAPAKMGIERCEEILNSQVNELDDINSVINKVLKKEKAKPDNTIKELRKMQKRLLEINAPDEEVNDAIKRLEKRIKIRNKARKNIQLCEEEAKIEENKRNYIVAVTKIKKFLKYITEAELGKDEFKRLVDYNSSLVNQRDEYAKIHCQKIKEEATTYCNKNKYSKAISLIPTLETYLPYLSGNNKKQTKELMGSINYENMKWEQYKNLFDSLKMQILESFYIKSPPRQINNAINSDLILDLLNNLSKLETYSKIFISDYNPQPKFSLKKNCILTIDERLQVIDFLINAGAAFRQTKLTKLREHLLNRKNELAAAPQDSNVWFNNPKYFEKYPDHPTALSSVKDLVVDKNLKFQDAFQLLIGLNTVRPYITDEILSIVESKELQLTKILIKKRFTVLKTKRRLAMHLADNKLFLMALNVANQIGNERWK